MAELKAYKMIPHSAEKGTQAVYEMDELVMCKDCKHYRYYGLSEETVSECRIDHAENPDGNWFCADGRKR